MKTVIALLVALLSFFSTGKANAKPALLIIGTPHFGEAGRHTIKTEVPEVVTARRQQEVLTVVERLASFRPTRVAVEWPADQQAMLDQRYAEYRAGRYKLTANEVDQLGLRLAAQLNLSRVDAVDWSGEPPGGWAHYNYEAYIKAAGPNRTWEEWLRRLQSQAVATSRLMACTPISTWLRNANNPANRLADHRNYFQIAQLGDRLKTNPGAAWVGNWYTRNLRILNNIRSVVGDDMDRIVVIFGAGHGYLLDQQARESDEFRLEDPQIHLPTSVRDGWTSCR